jgi:hypothetical protein
MRELQTWMMEAIASPIPPASEDVLARILPSHTLEAEARLDIYRDMYEVRLIEALEGDYPALAALLGHAKFHKLAGAYVARHPSMSYTLNRLGDRFPDFVAETTRRGVLFDLARLELAMTEVFDEAEAAPLGADALAGIAPRQLASVRLVTIPALRLLALQYPVNDVFSAYREEQPLVAPRKRASWLAVHRRDYAVYRTPLTARAFAMLSALRDGQPIGEAIESVEGLTAEELFTWFREWSAAGLFRSIV